MKLLLLCLLYSAIEGGGIFDIEISPHTLSTLPYGVSNLPIWENMKNSNRTAKDKAYYMMPLVVLAPEQSKCSFSILAQKTLLQLKLFMWSTDLQNSAVLHLRQVTGNEGLAASQVHPLPMEKLRLVWKSSVLPLSDLFEINTDWRPYSKLSNEIPFEITAKTMANCQELLGQMKEEPELFGNLHLEYVIHAKRSATKKITITGEHLVSGNLISRLKTEAGNASLIYLRGEDLNKISREIISTVVSSTTTTDDYVDTGDELSASKVLADQLKMHQTLTTDLSPTLWKSVYWNPDFARPDKVTNYINKVFTKDQGKTDTLRVNEKEIEKSGGNEVEVEVKEKYKTGTKSDGSQKRRDKVTTQDVEEWLKEKKYDVEWSGEKFSVKPLNLYRLNLMQFSTRSNIASTSVQLHQLETAHSTAVSVITNATQVLGHQNTNFRMDQLDAKLALTKANLEEQTTKALQSVSSVRSDLSDAKQKASKLNYYGWPSDGFCILSTGGSCPGGFSIRQHVYHKVHVISGWANGHVTTLKSSSSDSIPSNYFGDSRIRQHRETQHNGDVLEMDLYVCCKS